MAIVETAQPQQRTLAKQADRQAAMIETASQAPETIWHEAIVDYLFYAPDNRRRDAANLIQAMKPAIDGVVDAGLIKDDCWQCLTIGAVTVEVDKDNPRVELRFKGK